MANGKALEILTCLAMEEDHSHQKDQWQQEHSLVKLTQLSTIHCFITISASGLDVRLSVRISNSFYITLILTMHWMNGVLLKHEYKCKL